MTRERRPKSPKPRKPKPLYVLLLVGLLVGTVGCGSLAQGGVRIGHGPGVDFGTVVDYIRLDDEAGARSWMEKQLVPAADIDRYIVKAKIKVIKERAECQGKEACGL